MRSARGWAVAGLVAAMTAGAAVPAQASAGSCPQQGEEESSLSVWYRFGDIAEAVLLVAVPVQMVEDFVPKRYELDVETNPGKATLVAAHGSVDALSFGCSGGVPATVSEYGVLIKSRDGKALLGRNSYYLSLLTDDRRLITRLATLGAPIRFAHGQFDVQSNFGSVQVAAKESWENGAVELAATATEPAAHRLGPKPGMRFWFDGPKGTIRTAYECPDCHPRTPATGSVFGSGNSVVQSILGGARVNGSGFFIRTTLTATAELVD